jgi:hypothetical protein
MRMPRKRGVVCGGFAAADVSYVIARASFARHSRGFTTQNSLFHSTGDGDPSHRHKARSVLSYPTRPTDPMVVGLRSAITLIRRCRPVGWLVVSFES